MDSGNENDENTAAAAAAGTAENATAAEGLEEEKIGEDEIADQLEADPNSNGSGQFKTPEDERIEDTSQSEEKKPAAKPKNDEATEIENMQHNAVHEDAHKSNEEAAAESLPQNGTIATIPPANNNNTDQEDSAVFDTEAEDDRSVVEPGFMFIAGPDYTGTGIYTGYHSGSDTDGDTNINNEGEAIFQGFLPEDDPSRRSSQRTSRRSSRAESTEERVQRLIDNAITLDDSAVRSIPIDNAITLDDSAVRSIPIEEDDDEEANDVLDESRSDSSEDDDVASKSDSHPWFVPLFVLLLAACIILAIALPLSLRGRSANTTSSFNEAACLPGGVDARFELAKSILSEITSRDLLEDESTPQGKAIRWVACDDAISVQLLGNQDPSTGELLKQKHGFRVSGDSGEAQVTRRYILAVLSYSTSQGSPWADSLNFLSPDLHECNWHRNYTRQNFPYWELDPVGVFCIIDKGENSSVRILDDVILDDEHYLLKNLKVNFRIDNNLNGPLPPEIGYLLDCEALLLENNIRLVGQLPETMGNMISLENFSLLLNGPGFGGELPTSLFALKNLTTIHIESNLGTEWSLPTNAKVGNDTGLERLILKGNGFSGNIPSWLGQLNRLQTLDMSENNFQGAIPNTIGDLSSIKYLNLMDNNLTETIPPAIGRLPEIVALMLGNNKLQGELPTSIGNLQTLFLLDVGSNEMTSTIPSSFANLENLKYLVLESNSFNGTVDVLKAMKKLTVLLIRSNAFSGSIPDGLFSETSDDDNVAVDIGDNNFTGDLPTSFANMSNLVSLIGAKNVFVDDTVEAAVCNTTSMLVMDCDACECCGVCCHGENDGVCDFQLDGRTLLGYHCGQWFGHCLQDEEYFLGFGFH